VMVTFDDDNIGGRGGHRVWRRRGSVNVVNLLSEGRGRFDWSSIRGKVRRNTTAEVGLLAGCFLQNMVTKDGCDDMDTAARAIWCEGR